MAIIKIEKISKKYGLGQVHSALLSEKVESLFRKRRLPEATEVQPEFWALRDVSLEVSRGEVVGIIGRNGAGKSTLLKILSRITAPTSGRIELHGRVASLLEVGTGFHPELTGRENIFLNGSILGMKRAEIRSRFDEIVEFSEVAKFLDTPIKRYSSGMYVRLAFAVAAHLEPEVLLVDEVLAVGDISFQRKCLGKMSEVSREGRTILFVSHNLPTILSLTSRCVLFESGMVACEGSSGTVVDEYLKRTGDALSIPLAERADRDGNGAVRFQRVDFLDEKGNRLTSAVGGRPLSIVLGLEVRRPTPPLYFAIGFRGAGDQRLFNLSSSVVEAGGGRLAPTASIVCDISRLPLQAGRYVLNLFCETADNEIVDWVQNAVELPIVDGDFFGTGKLPQVSQGPILVEHRWRTV